MNSRQRYRMKYHGWFVEAADDILTKRMIKDAFSGLFVLFFLLTIPVSFPIAVAIRMFVTKRILRKEYGHDELMRDEDA